MGGKGGLIAGVAAGVVVIGGLLYFAMAPVEDGERPSRSADPSERADQGQEPKRTVPSTVSAQTVPSSPSADVAKRSEGAKEAPRPVRTGRFGSDSAHADAWIEEVPEEYRPLARGIVDASDNDDLKKLQQLAPQAFVCPDKEVRQRMVDALNWFGQDAIGDLKPFLTDGDPEVAQSAFNAWDTAVDMMDDESARLKQAGSVMKTLSDLDCAKSASAKFETAENRREAVNELIDVIESGNGIAAMAAKESYEFITGEPYESAEAAREAALRLEDTDK